MNKLPKSMGPAVKSDVQDIHHAETKAAALVAVEVSSAALSSPPDAEHLQRVHCSG